MNKIAMCAALIGCFGLSQVAVANDDIKLKRGCIKDNPLVEGMTDPALLMVYSELCDKKNKQNTDILLSKAAERFQQLGYNYHALHIISELESRSVSNHTLTDVKFLAGVQLADQALKQMRENQARYLTDDVTYPAAKQLIDQVQKALPSSVMIKEAPKPTVAPSRNTTRTQASRSTNSRTNTTRINSSRASQTTTPTQRSTNTTPPPRHNPTSPGNPFDPVTK